ncbi:hypothetical protein [Candidatus Mesenet endosymbiont of Phosphuga atrata]
MSRARGGHSFSYNDYKPDDLITEKYLELADKLEENGQDNFVDRLVI